MRDPTAHVVCVVGEWYEPPIEAVVSQEVQHVSASVDTDNTEAVCDTAKVSNNNVFGLGVRLCAVKMFKHFGSNGVRTLSYDLICLIQLRRNMNV